MASIEEQIVTAVGGAVTLRAMGLEQNLPLPAVTYTIVRSAPEEHLGGYTTLRHVTAQFDVWGDSISETKTEADLLLAALLPLPGRLENEFSGVEATGVFRRTIEYYLQLTEE